MCRHAVYLGPAIDLARFLLAPTHSLVEQAYAPRELKFAKLNADGFGFAWFDADGCPCRYVNPMPIWSDTNLTGLGRSLHAALWLASVRSATSGFSSGAINTQPFCANGLAFSHNGYLDQFNEHARPALMRTLPTEITKDLCGNTDSEYLFALIRHLHAHNPATSLASLVARAFTAINDWQAGATALLNVIISDGEQVVATRHALDGESPSLYFTVADTAFPTHGQLIASERLTDDPAWQPVPDHHVVMMSRQRPPQFIAL